MPIQDENVYYYWFATTYKLCVLLFSLVSCLFITLLLSFRFAKRWKEYTRKRGGGEQRANEPVMKRNVPPPPPHYL